MSFFHLSHEKKAAPVSLCLTEKGELISRCRQMLSCSKDQETWFQFHFTQMFQMPLYLKNEVSKERNTAAVAGASGMMMMCYNFWLCGFSRIHSDLFINSYPRQNSMLTPKDVMDQFYLHHLLGLSI